MAKILIVEDENDFRNGFINYVKHYGHTAIGAPSAEEGLVLLAHHPDTQLVMSDYNLLLAMNGYTLTQKIRQDPAYASFSKIPIIGIGSFPEHQQEFLTLVRQKPLDLDGILKDIADLSQQYRPAP